jgi:hypothetical protein
MTTPPDSRVDELRDQLRSLGYLNAGVDRFVLAPARDTRRPAAIALLASLRIGLLGGLLLGPAAAVGLSGRLPGLVTGARDALVVALYLALLFGLAIAVLAFMACLLVARLTGTGPDATPRARRFAVAAGTIAAAGSLAYLTLWWRAADAGLDASTPIWTAFALAVAAAISVLLGHAIIVAALAVSAAGRDEHAALPRVPGASWKATLAASALAFGGAITLLLATASAEEPLPGAPPLAVRSPGSRVTVLAIDGFDARFDEHRHLRSAGRPQPRVASPGPLTAFDGARATLAPSESRDPARVWTTIATGRRAEVHGVDALETRRVAGITGRLSVGTLGRLLGDVTDVLRLTRPTTASDLERRVKAFWEVAAGAGLRTAVVNWWATWPAPDDTGIVISDRAILRLDRGGALDAEIAPADLYERLRARWPQLRQDATRRLKSFEQERPPLSNEIHAVLQRSSEIDATVMALAESLDADLDLLVIYLPGLDIVQQTLLGGTSRSSAAALEERLAALESYYAFLGGLVGPVIAGAGSDRQLFVITQSGRLSDGPGVLATIGGNATRAVGASGTVVDAAPTILHALGVPVSRELDGRVLEPLFTQEFLAAHPVRHVDSYGLRGPTERARTGTPLDQEMIDRLRRLGYVR